MNDSASAAPPVLVERRGHVLIITLNRPEARNAINGAVWIGVGDALEAAEHDDAVRVIVITGAGEQSFCAGADLKALARGEPVIPEDPKKAAWGFGGITAHVLTKPLIAAVNGTALGGGTEIMLACDLVIAADHAVFGLPEVKRGVVAGAGGAFRLVRQLPKKIAMELLLTGDSIDAATAKALGLVNKVVEPSRLLDEAIALGERIAANAPLSVRATKRIANGIVDYQAIGEEAVWKISRAEGQAIMRTEDCREGPRAFAEKRQPVWKGR